MKLKKVLLIGGIATLGLALLGGFPLVGKMVAYARQTGEEWAEKNIDPEQEIKRLKKEVAKLDGEESAIKDDLAKEIAEADKQTKKAAALRAAVETERKDLIAFGETIKDAEAGNKKVSVGKVQLDVSEAKKKLVANRNAVVDREKSLAGMEDSLRLREEAKATLYAQLNEIQAVRTELSAKLDALAAKAKSVKLQKMKNSYHRDNSKLSEIREGIEKVEDKLNQDDVRVGLDTGKGKANAPVSESVDEILAPLSGK